MLDGLRGSAVAAVVYVHYLFYSGNTRAGGGYVGVLVFFVLSGYLITRVLWLQPRQDGRAGYRRFVLRRVRRLYPPRLVVVLVSTPVMAMVGPDQAGLAAVSAGLSLTQTTALWFGSGHAVYEPWVPTWSLTVEWVFYLVWPLALLRLRSRSVDAATCQRWAFGTAAVLYLVALPLSPRQFYILPIANVAVLLVGAGLALRHLGRPVGRPGGRDPQIVDLAFLLFLVVVLLPSQGVTGHWLYRLTQFPIAVLAAYMIIDQRPGTGGLTRRLLETRPMRLLGLTSYSTYLWHLPVLWIVWWGLPELSASLRVAIALAALVPLVWASYTFVEKPRLSRRLGVSAVNARPTTPTGSLRG